MSRVLCIGFTAIAALLTGCEKPPIEMSPPTKPEPAPELSKLSRIVGTWEGTAEMIEPAPDATKAEIPGTSRSGSTWAQSMGGMMMRGDGWYDMPGGQKQNYVEYVTWDSKAKKFHSWYFSDWGDTGEGWMTPDADGKTLHTKFTGMKPNGAKTSGGGWMRVADDNTIEWEFTEKGPMGTMTLKGTSKRVR